MFKRVFRVLTGVVVGGAIGSILGLTLAPKKGDEARKYLRDKSMEVFLQQQKKSGFLKKLLKKWLAPKNP